MKSSAKPKPPTESLRLAQLKAGKCIRVADTDKKAAHSAKIKFKAAKKIWKQSRKQARRSAKLAKLAQKQLADLAKKSRRLKKKQPPKESAATTPAPRKASSAKTARRRTRPTTTATAPLASPAVSTSTSMSAAPDQ